MSTTDAASFANQATSTRARPIDISLRSVLMLLASLRLTVVLFALSIILVLAGTLAQIDHDIWYVVNHYFRTAFAWIDFQVFFPRAWNVPGGMWFPGGWLIGGVMGVNLLAAHAIRFKVTATGRNLMIGLAILTAGIALTWLVIQSGLDDTVESQLSPSFLNGLWHALRFGLGAGTLALGYSLALNRRRMQTGKIIWLWWLGAITALILAIISIWLFVDSNAKLDPSGLRIMWQLIKSTGAGIVLLVGCYWVFGKRAGIVLLHGGVALLMFSELWTGLQAEESQMRMVEGQTLAYSEDIRSVELAVVNKSDNTSDEVSVIPLSMVVDAFENEQTISDERFPFAIRVKQYFPNAESRFAQPGEPNPATAGLGLVKLVDELSINTGAANAEGIDLPAMYVELLSNSDSKVLDTHLLWVAQGADVVNVEGNPYEISLRFERINKPYSVTLIDFKHDVYAGTTKAKNFSSLVQLREPKKNVDREFNIWMNNPLRYGGDTLYQSGFDPKNPRATTLQVATNSGWMIPYVSCMIVLIGMLAQFGTTFCRFARRESSDFQSSEKQTIGQLLSDWYKPAFWIPAGLLIVCAGYVLSKTRMPSPPVNEIQIHEFGKLPVAYNGRVKPFDTLSRNTLTLLSDKTTFEVDDPEQPGETIKKPAIFWLLEFLADTPESHQYEIFRVENLDVLQTLDLKPREGFRYGLAEIIEKKHMLMTPQGELEEIPLVLHQAQLASDTTKENRDLTQVKFLELGGKLNVYSHLREAFSSPPVRISNASTREQVIRDLQQIKLRAASTRTGKPCPIPPATLDESWRTLLEAEADFYLKRMNQQETDSETVELRSILDAYEQGEVQEFNAAVSTYRETIKRRSAEDEQYERDLLAGGETDSRKTAEKLRMDRIEFESFFNHFNPFILALALYLFAFVLACCSWLGWHIVLNRSANWILWFTFALHTYALVCRVYISGRPPVTNLYSSAVFIGWGAVAFALIFEKVYRFGIGNLLAAMVGFPTLYIAYGLAGDGDTFEVLQAVLDTQFWLATHVVCITLGYSTTLLAGFLGLLYVLMAHVAGKFDPEQRKQLTRMMYGTTCFAMFFSFVGTVLGGLWGDDSWGRFWGWDPKENGALMIVIWNALVLHARWGAMIRQRGLAVLSIFGNVMIAWSWFGVNQMSVGLHAYGFRKGMTFWLIIFVISQLFVMALGCLPEHWWRRTLPSQSPEAAVEG